MSDAFSRSKQSFLALKDNPILLLPMLITFGLGIGFAIVLLVQFLLGILISQLGLAATIAYAACMVLIDILLFLALGSFQAGMQYGAIHDVVRQNKTSLSRILEHGRRLFRQTFSYMAVRTLILLLPVVILGGIAVLLYFASPLAGLISAAFFLLLYFVFLIVFYVMNIYNYPILISENRSGMGVIASSVQYSRAHSSEVIVTSVMVVAIYLFVAVIAMIVNLPGMLMSMLSDYVSPSTGLVLGLSSFVFQVISSIIQAIGSIVIALFIFYSYFESNPGRVRAPKSASRGSKKPVLKGAARR